VVALSSCEVEYIAVSPGACQKVWLTRLLRDLIGSEPGVPILKVDNKSAIDLKSSSRVDPGYPIHESIAAVDKESMDAVESGSHRGFLTQLRETGNTVCGRHPIALFMAAVEQAEGLSDGRGQFKFVRYERSSLVEGPRDSSVSYASAFAVL